MQLLRKLFSRPAPPKVQSPLAWIKALNGMDDISAIEFATQKLSEDFRKNMFQDASSLEALFLVDEKTHNIVERITVHFINNENIKADLEQRISDAIFLYHRQLFIAYFSLIENSAQLHQETLHASLARTIRNATQMIKWRYYNYQCAPANVWLQLSQLYKIAEQNSLLNAKLQSYPDQEPISLSTAYIHACMLGTLESLSLKCRQIELISKMLIAWTAKISLDNVYDETQHLFYVDTASNKPARRIRNLKAAESNRYWSFDCVTSKIELCLSLIEYNILPKQPMMQELVSNNDAAATFEILHTEWSRAEYKRQRRAEERTQTILAVTTAYGFENVCNQIKQYEDIRAVQRGEGPNPREKLLKLLEEGITTHSQSSNEPDIIYMDLSTDYSQIVDQSSKGIGLKVAKYAHEVSLGMIVGISNKEQRYSTRLGIVRSIKLISSLESHIGIELLSNVAFCADAKSTNLKSPKLANKADQFKRTDIYTANTDFASTASSENSSFGKDASNFMCLYLPKEQSISQQETLIIPRFQYNKDDVFKINILGETTLVRFTESFEHHDNWVRVKFTTDTESNNTDTPDLEAGSSLPATA